MKKSLTVLHLGNVYFHRKSMKHGQEGVEIGSDAEVQWIGHLLGIQPEAIKKSLTTRTTVCYIRQQTGAS
jgi:myosin-15